MTMRASWWLAALGLGTASCAGNTHPAEAVLAIDSPLTAAEPGIELLAIGRLSGEHDLSRATSAPLENGAAGNVLGGLGSGLAYAGGNTFLALPDRGPNAVEYEATIDDTTSYVPRIQTLQLALEPSAPGSSLPFKLEPQLRRTTLLSSRQPLAYAASDSPLGSGAPAINSRHAFYFSGRSDNFDAAKSSTDPNDGRFDPEGVRLSNDGKHVFISDEYGPYVYQFDRRSGVRERVFQLPSEFAAAQLRATETEEIEANTTGRVTNKGAEGLAITPDGRSLVVALQSPLLQDGGTAGHYVRIVRIAIDSGESEQFAYELTDIGTAEKPKLTALSEIVAIDDHTLLVDERDSKGLGDDSSASFKRLFRIDLTDATDVTGRCGEGELAAAALPKTLVLDLVAQLNAYGIDSKDIPAKLEGVSFGPDIEREGAIEHTLFIASDNDFLSTLTDENHPDGIENPSQFFVFGVSDAVLTTPADRDDD
jgi:hypothetical protein